MRRQKRKKEFVSKEVQHLMIQLHLSTGMAKSHLWQLFTGYKGEDHGQILKWMRQLGYLANGNRAKHVDLLLMSKKKRTANKKASSEEALQARVKQLERQLQDSQLTAEAYRRMIQIAEKELKIDIQKKSNTK